LKYIIDLDAFKECLSVLYHPYRINGYDCVYVEDVREFIDKFPKEAVDGGD